MAVHIRLRRMGKKKRAFYRIVAADSRRARDGRFLEVLGTYNPIKQPAIVTVKEDRMSKWLDEGAVPSETVDSLLRQVGFADKYRKAKTGADVSDIQLTTTIVERKKKTRQMKKAALAKTEEAAAETTAEVEVKTEVKAEDKPEESGEAPAEESV